LIRQLLVESIVMAIGGGAFGILLASWVLKAIRHVSILRLPGVGEIRPDGMMLGFTIALSVATGVLFGLVPSLRASRPDLNDELRESGAGATNGLSARRRVFGITTRGILVIGQISLSVVLLIGAVLLMKSFANLRSVALGFQPSNLLTMKISLPPASYNADQKKAAFFRELVYRAKETPGVQDATVMMSLPTTRDWLGTNVLVKGQPVVDGSKQPTARVQSITPGYFRTLKIPLRRGREFAPRDNAAGAQPAVIINESFAHRFWPAYPLGGNPVGQHLREGLDHTDWMQIVGVVADVHENGLAVEPGPEFYVPTVVHPPQTAYLVVRTARNPLQLANAIRKQVLAIDSEQPVSDIKTMDEVLDATLGQRRLTMVLLGSFAGMALLLAVIGLYGVIAYSVSQRTQELGIRRALGAQQGDILRLVMSQALGLTLAGIMIGIAGAFALTRVMRNLLFQVSATDPVTFVGIAFLFLLVALIAGYVPARRAAQIDPMAALRIG
jgi:predicted permease